MLLGFFLVQNAHLYGFWVIRTGTAKSERVKMDLAEKMFLNIFELSLNGIK
jgi:hypothetical protein